MIWSHPKPTVPVAETAYNASAIRYVNRKASSREEPDVGNLHVRFCEGH
jgi:hypothetical protein